MMARMLVLLTAVLLCAADAPSGEPGAADLAKMQGDWMVVSMTVNGTRLPDDDAQALFRTVEGDSYTVSRYSKVTGKGTFKIDAAKTPKTIDSQPASPAGVKPILGIYEFDGQVLRICNAAPGKPRPTTFEAPILSDRTLIEWQRETK